MQRFSTSAFAVALGLAFNIDTDAWRFADSKSLRTTKAPSGQQRPQEQRQPLQRAKQQKPQPRQKTPQNLNQQPVV